MATSLVRSAPHNVTKLPSIAVSCLSRYTPVNPPANTSRGFATVKTSQNSLPDIWFTGSVPRNNVPNDHDSKKPPDERKLKLGKSRNNPLILFAVVANTCLSSQNSPRTYANSSSKATPTRITLPSNNPTPLSLYTPTSTNRLWQSRILGSIMDLSYRLGENAFNQ